jgi:hypothetical protein
MLAEIFMLRLETQLRIIATNAVMTLRDTRFVPVTPVEPLRDLAAICAAGSQTA